MTASMAARPLTAEELMQNAQTEFKPLSLQLTIEGLQEMISREQTTRNKTQGSKSLSKEEKQFAKEAHNFRIQVLETAIRKLLEA